jgi:hypothetical protein
MKSSLLFTVSLCISVLGYDFNLDTNNICKYTMCKINDDSAFHKYHATVFAKSKFDSLLMVFRSRVHTKDTSLKNINIVSGGLFGEATNYLTYPIVQRMNKIIEAYCIKNTIAVFITYPPYGIHYANGETNDFPDPADSMYIKKLVKCSIPDVTDTVIQLFNNDPEISNIQKAIDKEYKSNKKKMDLKIDSLLKIKN